ncbi:hypothetical protein [Bifidobacterium longum]|uniref:hypothetical protein n=1 Tax=Bifidobacterium longum TaxID=216816 RepID=UPI003B58AF76
MRARPAIRPGNTGDAGDESAQNADGASSHDGDSDAASGASASSDGVDTAVDSGMTVRVVGLTDDPNGAYAYYGGASVLSDNVITAMAGSNDFGNLPVYLVYLDIDDASDTAAASTVKQVSTLLPKHFSVQSRAAFVEESVKSMSSGETSITTIFLLSFGILAMLVAALVIANTFQVSWHSAAAHSPCCAPSARTKASCMSPCCLKPVCWD